MRKYRYVFSVVGHNEREKRPENVDKVSEVEKSLPLERQTERRDVHCGVAQVQRQRSNPRIAGKVVELGFQAEIEQSHPGVVHQYQAFTFERQIFQYHVQNYRQNKRRIQQQSVALVQVQRIVGVLRSVKQQLEGVARSSRQYHTDNCGGKPCPVFAFQQYFVTVGNGIHRRKAYAKTRFDGHKYCAEVCRSKRRFTDNTHYLVGKHGNVEQVGKSAKECDKSGQCFRLEKRRKYRQHFRRVGKPHLHKRHCNGKLACKAVPHLQIEYILQIVVAPHVAEEQRRHKRKRHGFQKYIYFCR